jgi:hypothetical protein
MNICKKRENKVQKTDNLWFFFSKSKGHNFLKNQQIKAKLKLNLHLCIAKQCTKYQMNICKQREKKCVKLIIRDLFFKSKGHNFVKNQRIRSKLKLDLYLGMAKQGTKYQMIMRKKVRKTYNSWFFSMSKGHNFVKNQTQTWSVSWYVKAMYQITNEYL